MRDGQLLMVRSTLAPGVTQRLVGRAAERGLAVDVAYCPERTVQGHSLEELHRLPQLIGGATAHAGAARRPCFSIWE